MKLGLMLFLVAFVSYFIGTVNFAKIISWNARRKDITKIGSKNPGTMNMLRSHGFGLALATFACEIAKSGLTCLLFKLCFNYIGLEAYSEIAYFTAGLFMVIGYDFPCWSKFKGGKGVAVFAGIFLFSPIWYVAIGWFVICFVLLIIIDIGSITSFLYTLGLSIALTLYAWLVPFDLVSAIVTTCVIWFLYILMLVKHHANISRLIQGKENKVGFKDKLRKVFHKNKNEQIIDEQDVETTVENEIVVEDDSKKDE
ncbi:MAG: glycerol-3-phosphate acyltransferase [Clostridia bacterium]|nr:glycerol-3-phosphate acyltransferase [Clostridia bacterium]MBQ8792955.1 glycerol-3-phosphate acyltransferase [Clostridia bacterium]